MANKVAVIIHYKQHILTGKETKYLSDIVKNIPVVILCGGREIYIKNKNTNENEKIKHNQTYHASFILYPGKINTRKTQTHTLKLI